MHPLMFILYMGLSWWGFGILVLLVVCYIEGDPITTEECMLIFTLGAICWPLVAFITIFGFIQKAWPNKWTMSHYNEHIKHKVIWKGRK